MRIYLAILVACLVPGALLAQAEFNQVRAMFSKPNAYVPVQVWKGLMYNSHPVEFYIGERDSEVYGYYRIISSGDKFILEGEVVDQDYVLTEYNQQNQVLGTIVINKAHQAEQTSVCTATWTNVEHTDVLPLQLVLSDYSDHPPSVFKPAFKKFAGVNPVQKIGLYESYFIEILNEHEIIVHYGGSATNWSQRIECDEIAPLKFEIEIDGMVAVFHEIGDKLRRRYLDEFAYFNLENQAASKKIAYSNLHFVCDVDYPVITDRNFNAWIETLVDKRKQQVRKIIAEAIDQGEVSPSEIHFKYKWLGWTEIDLLTEQLISGRIVFNQSWDNQQEIIAFTYDLTEGRPLQLIEEFKQDFNMQDYINNVVQGEINEWKRQGADINPALEAHHFVNLTVSDYHLIISNDFDRIYGYQHVQIPLSELKSLVKRSSILKNLMR